MSLSKKTKIVRSEQLTNRLDEQLPLAGEGIAIDTTNIVAMFQRDGSEVDEYHHFPANSIREVWLNIYGKLDTKTKITFSRCSAKWHDWVATKRTNLLSTEVFPTVICSNALTSTTLKTCREICQSWTGSIDYEIQHHPSRLQLCYETESYFKNGNIINGMVNDFTSYEQIDKFLNEMRTHPGNPFPGRSIMFEYDIPETGQVYPDDGEDGARDFLNFWGKANKLVNAFGSHVYFAEFVLFDEQLLINITDVVQFLRNSFPNLRNLKRLELGVANDSTNLEESIGFYGRNPLPQLPHLETLTIYGQSNAILSAVLETSTVTSVLTRLTTHLWNNDDMPLRLNPAIFRFQNLEALDVDLNIEDLDGFGSLRGRLQPLKYLALRIRYGVYDFEHVFRKLQVFGDSLVALSLSIKFTHESIVGVLSTGFVVNLPNLEKLELESFNGTLDPFCKVQTLQYLRFIDAKLEEFDGSVLDVFGFENRMDISNIWSKIPSLQEICFERNWHPFFRKTYSRPLPVCIG